MDFFALPRCGWVLASMLGLGCTGCLHLNIPSVRHGEPPGLHTSHIDGVPITAPCGPAGDCGAGAEEPPAEPDVPWPRFHPLPTRPVLGPRPAG